MLRDAYFAAVRRTPTSTLRLILSSEADERARSSNLTRFGDLLPSWCSSMWQEGTAMPVRMPRLNTIDWARGKGRLVVEERMLSRTASSSSSSPSPSSPSSSSSQMEAEAYERSFGSMWLFGYKANVITPGEPQGQIARRPHAACRMPRARTLCLTAGELLGARACMRILLASTRIHAHWPSATCILLLLLLT